MMRVLDDPRVIQTPSTDELQTKITDGILANGIVINTDSKAVIGKVGLSNTKAFSWESWDVPTYQERLKDSYPLISDYFKKLDAK